MERRTFMAMLTGGIVAAPLAAEAQQAAKIARIGYLTGLLGRLPPTCQRPSVKGLRDLGLRLRAATS